MQIDDSINSTKNFNDDLTKSITKSVAVTPLITTTAAAAAAATPGVYKPYKPTQSEKLSTITERALETVELESVDSSALTTLPSSIPPGTTQTIEQSDPLVATTAEKVSELGTVKSTINVTATPAFPTVIEKLTEAVETNNSKALEKYLKDFSGGSLSESLQPLLTKLLMVAAENGSWEAACILIENGADITGDQTKLTPLMHAVIAGNLKTVELIIKKAQSDPMLLAQLFNARDESVGNTVFTFAVVSEQKNILEMFIRVLYDTPIPKDSLNIPNYKGFTPLMYAIREGDEEIVNLLIKKADRPLLARLLKDCNQDSDTAFTLAAKDGRTNIVNAFIEALIAAKINPNSYLNVRNNNGETPLILAAMNGHEETVKLLLTKAGVERNIYDNSGYTALMHAAWCRKWGIVQMLSRYGANLSDIHKVLAEVIGRDSPTELAQELMKNGASLEKAEEILNIKVSGHTLPSLFSCHLSSVQR